MQSNFFLFLFFFSSKKVPDQAGVLLHECPTTHGKGRQGLPPLSRKRLSNNTCPQASSELPLKRASPTPACASGSSSSAELHTGLLLNPSPKVPGSGVPHTTTILSRVLWNISSHPRSRGRVATQILAPAAHSQGSGDGSLFS